MQTDGRDLQSVPLMGSGALIYIRSFRKIDSGIQKLIEEWDSQTQRQHGDLISLLLFLQNEESRLKMEFSCFLQFPMNREHPKILEL
jgi:hypothetical protein